MEQSQIAIYVSIGSLAVSAISFIYAIRQSQLNRKIEKIRAYDKVYHDASDLLLHRYKKQMNKPFVNDDKYLEQAVNDRVNSNWLEEIYGMNVNYPPDAITPIEKAKFNANVSDAYFAHEEFKRTEYCEEFINFQSPVFCLDDEEFRGRFERLMVHVTENLSYFSLEINKNWESARLRSPETVKNEYLALKRVNEMSCEPIEEDVEDPYLRILLSIRHEYRQLNKPLNDKFSDFWFRASSLPSRIKYKLSRKRSADIHGI